MTSSAGTRPPKESARLSELKRMQILDSAQERAYDDITRMAASICGTPVALISLVDGERQWFKSRIGTQVTQTPREVSFCAHTIDTARTLVVPDATKDARFEANPLVTDDPHIRFYAGAPLVTTSGHVLGTVCVIDTVAREVSQHQLEQLEFLARQVVTMLEERTPAAP